MRRPFLALAIVAALVAGACSSGGGEEAAPTTQAPAAPANTTELDLELASSVMPSVRVEIPEDPIATAPALLDGFHLDVYALDREGDESLLLIMALRNDSDGNHMIQRELEDPEARLDTDYMASGVTLFDPTNLKRHLVYIDDGGGCLCSRVGTTTVEEGQSLHAAALFPAPPDGVDSMTVQTPIGSVPDVPISDG